MVKLKLIVFPIIIITFLFLTYYPTLFELSYANRLKDTNREFILEHNYYWPDYNLYLSKIRQGIDGRWTAVEKYTTEPHAGSLIQEFYVVLGQIARLVNLDPNGIYLAARLVLSPLLLLIILRLIFYFFRTTLWRILGFLITVSSGSLPFLSTNSSGNVIVGRIMEWWSNLDILQRISHLPHIMLGQILSFYILYRLIILKETSLPHLIVLVILGLITGLVFPPSLMTLLGVIILYNVINYLKHLFKYKIHYTKYFLPSCFFILLSLPSLLYLYILTKQIPWNALVETHRLHPLPIALDQYVLASGLILILGFLGGLLSIIRRDIRLRPLIYWVVVTFLFAALFTIYKEQSPLRFTQTGLFIPLGILGTYFLKTLFSTGSKPLKLAVMVFIVGYLGMNSLVMYSSWTWQRDFIIQRVRATIPPVPAPPQTMYPLKSWMDAIRYLRDFTNHDAAVLALVTAENYIPAYAGNAVYYGQANTVDYERKETEAQKFFSGNMSENQARLFLQNGNIRYVFVSIQEKEKLGNRDITKLYPFFTQVYQNPLVTIYRI